MKSHIMIGLAWSLLVIAAMAGITLYAGSLLPEGDRIPLRVERFHLFDGDSGASLRRG